jgi:hypothetical protein
VSVEIYRLGRGMKRKMCFIKNDISRNVNSAGGDMKATVSFMLETIADEDT